MAYKTLVASSATQQRWTIDSNAHTLAELKEEFRTNNIPYEGLAITEGLCTKAELTRDDAEIPVSQRTVSYNGETYSRVFLITNARKQIASGCYPTERKEFGPFIKEYNLGEAIKETFGDNWTRVSTDNLISFFKKRAKKFTGSPIKKEEALKEVREEVAKVGKKKEEKVNTKETKLPDVKTAPHPATVEWFYDGIKAMVKENTLFTDDVAVLADLTTELYKRLKEEQPVMSESDLEDMLFDARNH